ncbi:MAG: hypothetical protein IPM54_01015 [Polyangiaceae bacterium]|nr:hypothetical protein [Polyangiaceae bacterium]
MAAPTTYLCARESSGDAAGAEGCAACENPIPQKGHAISPAKTWRLQAGHRTMAFIDVLPSASAVRR